jgi:hypothetical protein
MNCRCPIPETDPPRDDSRWCKKCHLLVDKSDAERVKMDGEVSALRNEMRMMQRRHNEEIKRLRERIEGLTQRLAGHV